MNSHPRLPSLALCVWLALSLDAPAQEQTLGDKTLVAWVAPSNATQRGGSALTLDDRRGGFDAIVLGEIEPGRWMAGSDHFRRTQRDQASWPAESEIRSGLIQIAIAWSGSTVAIYRNAVPYARHPIETPRSFGPDSVVVLGLRHLDAGDRACFAGSIADARIYDVALQPSELAALRPAEQGERTPWAWWSFGDGTATDRMMRFPASTLFGDARLANGRLELDGASSYLVASSAPLAARSALADGEQRNRDARTLREQLLADPHRPGYHFVTPEGVCMPFDPNGAIFWRGRYHLFYIFQDHRGHNWGHASSADLFHWRHHPTGLTEGMFSGNCFLDAQGRPTVCYHQVGLGNAIAVALDDELDEWRKLESNPITPPTKPGEEHHGRYRSWDPYGWWEQGSYYAIFGGDRPGLAKAPTLAGPWRYTGDFLAHGVDGVALDEDVSCADFFALGDRHVLLCISHRLGCRYYTGAWRDEQFHPTFHARMSWVDNAFFAPETLLDDRGRRILWAWILDGPNFATRSAAGWSGTLSLPRVLSMGEDGSLRLAPPLEIERLRQRVRRHEDLVVAADGGLMLPDCAGDSLELAITMRGAARRYGVEICRSPDGTETTPVSYDAVEHLLALDTTRSGVSGETRSIEAAPLELAPDESLRLRVFVDRSVVEVFANERQAVVRRIYPARGSRGVRLFAVGGTVTATVEAWDLAPSNPY